MRFMDKWVDRLILLIIVLVLVGILVGGYVLIPTILDTTWSDIIETGGTGLVGGLVSAWFGVNFNDNKFGKDPLYTAGTIAEAGWNVSPFRAIMRLFGR